MRVHDEKNNKIFTFPVVWHQLEHTKHVQFITTRYRTVVERQKDDCSTVHAHSSETKRMPVAVLPTTDRGRAHTNEQTESTNELDSIIIAYSNQ